MSCALLVVLGLGAHVHRARAEEPPIALRPYVIRAWVAVDPEVRLDARGRSKLVADWLNLVRRFVGSPWVLEVAEGDGPLATQRLDDLEASAIVPLAGGVDKAWAIRIEPEGGGYAFRGREFDALTGRLGPPRRRLAPHPADAARPLLGLVLDLFCPTAEIGPESGGGVTLTVRGAALPAASPAGRVVDVGSVFVPLRIFQKPDGTTLDVREIRRSYLRVEALEGSVARCGIVSSLRDPLSRRVARKNTLVALGAKPAERSTRLRYVQGEARIPAAGYTLTVRTLPDGPPREVGTTGRDGRIVLEPRLADGLMLVRLLAAGIEPLDEFPMLPGEELDERTILIDPKPEAVALEAGLDVFRDELIDLVATRARLEARLKARAEGGKWDEVAALLGEFRALPHRDTFDDRLARLKDEAARRQAETKTAILTRTAQAMISDTQALIDRYLVDDAFKAYEEALREARATPPAAPESAEATSPFEVTRPAPEAAQGETPHRKTVASAAKSGSVSVDDASKASPSLAEARRGFVTTPGGRQPPNGPVPSPPPRVFRLVNYPSPVGELSAYLTPDPGDGRKHPAIVWITGGDCNSIGEVWEPSPRENDQTAAAYREAGIVMMFPSLRGGNDNPGRREGFLGEVDDVIAARDYLAAQPHVDPGRIYLGGHSTGGTLAMLVAEMTDRFRATFAFGPADDIRGYGGDFAYHRPGNPKESRLRSPAYWLDSVRAPLFVIEGSEGNRDSLRAMRKICTNPQVRFVEVPGVDHFAVLAPANEAIAAKILADDGPTVGITLTESELKGKRR